MLVYVSFLEKGDVSLAKVEVAKFKVWRFSREISLTFAAASLSLISTKLSREN